MQAIAAVLSGPLPIAISTTVALACLAAVWFFALPLLEEVKNLRNTNAELQSVISTYVQRSDVGWTETVEALEKINSKLGDNGFAVQLAAIQTLVAGQSSTIESLTTNLVPDLLTRLQAISRGLATHIESEERADRELSRELERISRTLDQVTRQLTDMNERQSQVTGILTGMSMVNNSNRSL